MLRNTLSYGPITAEECKLYPSPPRHGGEGQVSPWLSSARFHGISLSRCIVSINRFYQLYCSKCSTPFHIQILMLGDSWDLLSSCILPQTISLAPVALRSHWDFWTMTVGHNSFFPLNPFYRYDKRRFKTHKYLDRSEIIFNNSISVETIIIFLSWLQEGAKRAYFYVFR